MRYLAALLVIFAFVVSPVAFSAGAQSDDISWTLPTLREDNTPLLVGEIDRIELEISRDGQVIATEAFPPAVTAYTFVRDLPPNYTLCYRAKTVDTDGLESVWTDPVCKTVKGRPNPPNLNSVR